jgi:hypothetical protein
MTLNAPIYTPEREIVRSDFCSLGHPITSGFYLLKHLPSQTAYLIKLRNNDHRFLSAPSLVDPPTGLRNEYAFGNITGRKEGREVFLSRMRTNANGEVEWFLFWMIGSGGMDGHEEAKRQFFQDYTLHRVSINMPVDTFEPEVTHPPQLICGRPKRFIGKAL